MAKNLWYAWHDAEGNGGVCQTWDECQRASNGKRGEKHKGFRTYDEAWAFAHPDQLNQSQKMAGMSSSGMSLSEQYDEVPPWESDAPQGQPETLRTPSVSTVSDTEETPGGFVHLDFSRVEKTPISDKLNRFCAQFRFAHLSEDQKRAVQAEKGKYLLFAVPGSGKTTVLMARTGYLIHGCGIQPDRLMTMTFTRASAKEMRKRYCDFFHPSEDQIPDFRTIHSFCYSIIIPMLRHAGFHCPSHIINEDIKEKNGEKKYTQRVVMAAVLKKYLGTGKASDETVQETAQTAFSSIKNREMTQEEYNCYFIKFEKAKYLLAPMFKDYQEILRKLDCMDYDDMLLYALNGLRAYPSVLHTIQDTYHYWSIDEAQDNSKVQHELLSLLAGAKGNLFMVGDDDQSIYGFRGAEPNMLLEFGNQPDVHLLVMGTNFRSDSGIVRAAKSFVEVNRCRADKNMNASHAEPGEINILPSFSTEAQQYEYIVKAAQEAVCTKTKLGILYQLNISALPVIVHLHKAGISFEASRGLTELLHKRVIGGILRILRFSQQPCNLEVFQECKSSLGLYWLGDELTDQLKKSHSNNRRKPLLQIIIDSLEENTKRRQSVFRIHSILQEIRGKRPPEAVMEIIKSPELELPSEVLTDRLTIYSLLSICDMFNSVPEMLESLSDMEGMEKQKENVIPEEEKTEVDYSVVTGRETSVTLSTIHSAKGREWDRILLIDSFQETFPGEPQFDRIGFDPEEARRVFYVAITRAIHRLDVLTVEFWHGNSEKISKFIPEFAWAVEQSGEWDVSEQKSWSSSSCIQSSESIFMPKVFYGVPVGRNPGVYTDYQKVEEQVKGFPVPAGKQQKKFFSYEDAWQYTFPGQPIPVLEEPPVLNSISRIIQLSGGATFNKAIDIPPAVRNSVYEHLGVKTLYDLSQEEINRLKAECDLFSRGSHADYHGHTDGYTVTYMPVNFHKVWLPLWMLLEDGKLPFNAGILELGPGPGTATWSLVEFYRLLASDNPNLKFSLLYTAVERETDFRYIFACVQEKLQNSFPDNLSITMNLIPGVNAFDYLTSQNLRNLDIVLESNMLNEAENIGKHEIQSYLGGIQQKLREHGFAIFIEPGKNSTLNCLRAVSVKAEDSYNCSIYKEATKSAVYLGDNTLVREALKIGLRYKQKMEHWFSYMILERKGNAL